MRVTQTVLPFVGGCIDVRIYSGISEKVVRRATWGESKPVADSSCFDSECMEAASAVVSGSTRLQQTHEYYSAARISKDSYLSISVDRVSTKGPAVPVSTESASIMVHSAVEMTLAKWQHGRIPSEEEVEAFYSE